jgi:hypothetical protein
MKKDRTMLHEKRRNPKVKRCSDCPTAVSKGENYECPVGFDAKVLIAKSLGKRQAVCDDREAEFQRTKKFSEK